MQYRSIHFKIYIQLHKNEEEKKKMEKWTMNSSNKNNNLFNISGICIGIGIGVHFTCTETKKNPGIWMTDEKEVKSKQTNQNARVNERRQNMYCNLKRMKNKQIKLYIHLNDEQMPDNWVCACFVRWCRRLYVSFV